MSSSSSQQPSATTPQWFIDSDDIPKSTFSKPSRQQTRKSASKKVSAPGIEGELKKLVARDKEKDSIIKEQAKEITKLRQQIIKIQKMSSACKIK